jgi:molecular chaperone DnaK (HSP70)
MSTISEGSYLGLDIGCLQSRVAVIRGGRAEVIADADGHQYSYSYSYPYSSVVSLINFNCEFFLFFSSVPSAVGYYADESPLAGVEAHRKKTRALTNTLTHLKAILGNTPDVVAAILTREGIHLRVIIKTVFSLLAC